MHRLNVRNSQASNRSAAHVGKQYHSSTYSNVHSCFIQHKFSKNFSTAIGTFVKAAVAIASTSWSSGGCTPLTLAMPLCTHTADAEQCRLCMSVTIKQLFEHRAVLPRQAASAAEATEHRRQHMRLVSTQDCGFKQAQYCCTCVACTLPALVEVVHHEHIAHLHIAHNEALLT
eukprot:9437-Heterococcus_DN1.PRE.1